MNRRIWLAVLAAALAAPALAAEEHHPDQAQKPAATSPAKPAAANPAKPPAQDPEKTTQRMKDNLKAMEGQIENIRKAKDPAERERLLQEHMQTMRENMMMGQSLAAGPGAMGMMGGGMMGPGMMEQCMRMMGGGMGPEAMMGRMQQMEKRMDMMQMMMEQMLKPQVQPQRK